MVLSETMNLSFKHLPFSIYVVIVKLVFHMIK